MSAADATYSAFLSDILSNGDVREDRTGVGTIGVFGRTMRFRMRDGFPMLTTKKLHWNSILHELLWIISGDTNIKYLQDNGVRIWNEWADENGDLGPVYGAQLRSWNTGRFKSERDRDGHLWHNPVIIDQLKVLIEGLRSNPFSRRHVITLWNPADLDQMRLPPCHGVAIQFNVRANGHLDLQMTQRSADAFLGVPFNIASYSLLLHMVASAVDRIPGEFIWVGGDCHVYSNHIELAHMQLERKAYDAPELMIHPGLTAPIKEVQDMVPSDIELLGYLAHPAIKAEVAV
jgi:thymidylate synthase